MGGQESYGMSGSGRGRGTFKGRAGYKRNRHQEGLNGKHEEQPDKSIVEVSMEHEYSD